MCAVGFYGEDCGESCDCADDEPCDHVTGECKCRPGYVGKSCELSKFKFNI